MKPSYKHPMSRKYAASVKKPSLWLAKTWFCGCLMSCLGTGGMLVHAWQSQETERPVAVVQAEEPKRVEVAQTKEISEAAVLLATLRQSTSNSAPQAHRSTVETNDSESLTAWFDAAQR